MNNKWQEYREKINWTTLHSSDKSKEFAVVNNLAVIAEILCDFGEASDETNPWKP